jgi:sugar transferase (PEP-CTERM/EpsH1 system associated)
MIDRRNFPRLNAHVLWRPLGLIGPQLPVVDVSLGGMRMYSDERLKVGTRVEIDLLLTSEPAIEFLARVVRIDALPAGSPAAYDVALAFLDVPPEARSRLAARLAMESGPNRALEVREDEHQRGEVSGIEDEHGEQHLLQTPTSIPIARGPNGDHHVREQDRDEENLLHRLPVGSEALATDARKTKSRARGRLKVLFVTPYLPSPPRFGGQMRLHGLIAGMAAKHDVSVLSLVDSAENQDESVRATEAYCRRVTTVPNPSYSASHASKRRQQLGSLFSSHSYEWLVHRQPALVSALERAMESERYDIVNFEFTHMAACRTKRSGKREPAFVLDEHNIEYDLVRQTARAGTSAVRRAYSAIDWRKLRAEEMRSWGAVDGCTLTSEHDQEMLLADAPATRTAVVSNGVDIDFFQPQDPPLPRAPDTLLFFGAIDYYPNTDGLRFFLKDVFPLLESRAPGVKLSIVGRRPPDEILAHRSPSVEVTGAVDDVRPHIERAAVVIVPLRLGSGTRLKILEAMAMGKAVVTTTLGAEGLAVVPDRDLLVADDPETFAKQIRRLLDDPELALRIGAAARRLVVSRYTWKASVERLSDFYGEVLDARAERC